MWGQSKATLWGWEGQSPGPAAPFAVRVFHARDHVGPKRPPTRLSSALRVPAGLGRVLREEEETV